MKPTASLPRFLSIGFVAALAVFFWRWKPPIEIAPPSPAKFAASPALPPPPRDRSDGSNQPTSPRQETTALADTSRAALHAVMHSKLRQLLEAKTGDSDTQDQLMKELVVMLTDENAADIIRSLQSEELLTPFGTAALDRWLSVDLPGAANWIAARSDATEEQAMVVARKMLSDPAALHAYCDQLPEGQWRENILSSAAHDILAKDPAEAIKLAQQMTPGAAQTNLLQTVAYDWTHRDPDAALAWILKVTDPTLREGLFAVGAKAIAVTDPDLAAGWLVTAVKSEGVSNETALCIVETWVAQDPAKAAGWVALFPANGPREAAMEIVSRRWLQSDPGAATAWIRELPEREKVLAKLKAEQEEREREAEM